MTEEDRKIVNRLKSSVEREKKEPTGGVGLYFIDEKVLPLINRLDKQIIEIKESGEPFRKVAARIEAHLSDCWIIYSTSLLGGGEIVNLQVGDIRRLDKVLKEVNHE